MDLVFLVFYWGFSFPSILLRFYLCVCVYVFSSLILSCNFIFCDVFVLFCYHSAGGLTEWSWGYSFLCSFWHSFKRTSFKFSLKVWYNSSVKTSGHGFFFVGSLDLLSLIFLAAQCGMQDLSLLARYKTHAACIGSMESEPLDCQVSLCWGFGNHSFIFSTCEWSVHISYFFLVQSCDIYF